MTGLSMRVVYRAWKQAEKFGLIEQVKARGPSDFTLHNVPELERWIPTNANQDAVRPAPSGKSRVAPSGRSRLARSGNHNNTPHHNPTTKSDRGSGSSADHRSADGSPLAAASAQRDTMTTRHDMLNALHDDPTLPEPPEGCRVVLDGRPMLHEVSPTDHAQAWLKATGRPWAGKWTGWLAHVLPFLTAQHHGEWLAEVYQQENVPALKWHARVIQRIVDGVPRHDPAHSDHNRDHFERPEAVPDKWAIPGTWTAEDARKLAEEHNARAEARAAARGKR
jgi:hypothetical protein